VHLRTATTKEAIQLLLLMSCVSIGHNVTAAFLVKINQRNMIESLLIDRYPLKYLIAK
jgi:hypothetical protein